jgi:DNA-binding transcriptional ArsR family regulator
VVALRELPARVKNALERRSLELLSRVAEDIVVVGGWAARAWSGAHVRYTYDVDGVADEEELERAHEKLTDLRLTPQKTEWGYIYTAPSRVRGAPADLLIKIELSLPRIYDVDGLHYFEFDLRHLKRKTVKSVDGKFKVEVRVPEPEYVLANKLGLPAYFKNEYDAGILLPLCNVDKLVEIIKGTDRWRERVLERGSAMLDHLKNPKSLSHQELSRTVDIGSVCVRLEEVLEVLRAERDTGNAVPPHTGQLERFAIDVLSCVRDLGEACPKLLCERMHESYQRIYYHIRMLAKRGYVIARREMGQNNRYVLKLRITPAGEAVLQVF